MQGIAWGQYETGYTHELAHWLGVDFNGNGQLPEYHDSDGAHLSGHCTIHGPLQGPVWCWDEGYPCAVSFDGGDAILEPNHKSSGAFDGTFRYVSYASAEGKRNQRHSQIVLYAAGLLPRENVTETYYCVGGAVDDSDPTRITASVVDSFGIDRFVEAHGDRVPSYPKPLAWSADGDIRVGQITVSDRQFTEAEVSWWTLWNRHYEDDVSFDPMTAGSHHGSASDRWGWGQAGWSGGFPTWTYATNGLSRARTKLSGVACEPPSATSAQAPFRPRSCDELDDAPAAPCDLNTDPFVPPSPPTSPPAPPSPPAHPHWLPALPPPPRAPMTLVWLVYYDTWVGSGAGELGGWSDCLQRCEQDASCVGVQFHSSEQYQCYKLEDEHVSKNMGQGLQSMSREEAVTLPSTWSVFLKHRTLAPSPPSPPPAPPKAPSPRSEGSTCTRSGRLDPSTCELSVEQLSSRCSCQYRWAVEGCEHPTEVALVCDA